MPIKKKQIFNLPIKLIFGEEGENFFIKNNKKMERFKMADGKDAWGIKLSEYSIPSIQRLLQMDYISAIEMSSSNFIDSRHEVIDFSKLVMYSRFYKKFNEIIYSHICNSDMVRSWNRANPTNMIAEDKKIKEEIAKKLISGNPQVIKSIKALIMTPVKQQINISSDLLPGEKNVQLLFSEKMLNSLSSVIWFILFQYHGEMDYAREVDFISSQISGFLSKVNIPEYFALMFMELLALTENTKLKNYAARELGKQYNLDQILSDDAVRKTLLEKTKNDNIYVSWKIKSYHSTQNTVLEQIEVTIYNRDTKYRAIKEKIDVKKDLNLKEKSLTEFYTESQEGAGNELGLFYISYLDEACRKVDMRFESNVNFQGPDDLTVITLRLLI